MVEDIPGPCSGRYPCNNCHTKIQRAINEDSPSVGNTLGLVGDAAITAAAVSGLVTNPIQQPNTNSLADTHQDQGTFRKP